MWDVAQSAEASSSRYSSQDAPTIWADHESIPTRVFIHGVRVNWDKPVAGGAFSDVFRGSYKERDVAVKRFRSLSAHENEMALRHRFCQEALTWRQLSHPRILQFLGIDQDAFESAGWLCIISPWMAKGTLMAYLMREGGAPVNHKLLMTDVASGLQFLHGHNPPLVHGDLHGFNVLIDGDYRAVLGDFGLTMNTDGSSETVKAGAIRWLSPELLPMTLHPLPKTTSGDIFAFGRICLSIFTRRLPFHELVDIAVILQVMENIHPARPSQEDCFGTILPDDLWELILGCWSSDAMGRPHIGEAVRILEDTASTYLPPSLFIKDVLSTTSDDIALASGSFADVSRGTYQGQEVAIKRFRLYASDGSENKKLYKRFYREAQMWQKLRHPRILEFVGIDEDALRDEGELCIISPWMTQGTLMDYLGNAGDLRTDNDLIFTDILSGLNYLHSQSLAHGDLHGSNVFINSEGHALLGDFGLTAISNLSSMNTTINNAGALRWLSPELLQSDSSAKTTQGDIFAFGRICLSVLTRCLPFYKIADVAVIVKVVNNIHPERPKDEECHGNHLSDEMWELILRCWDPDSLSRPQVAEVIHTMDRIARLHVPSALFIQGVRMTGKTNPTLGGVFYDIVRGTYEGQGVTIRRLRITAGSGSGKRFHEHFYHEALLWRRLRHPRILPFLGVDLDAFKVDGSVGMISPWMTNGTLRHYLRLSRGSLIPHKLLITDIAAGLAYLHAQAFAHGNLNNTSIFVDDRGRALIGDFGLTTVTQSEYGPATIIWNQRGPIRWMAPELVRDNNARTTMSSDIFAFGRVCYSIYTRRTPFHGIADMAVVLKVMNGVHPGKDTGGAHADVIPDDFWQLLLQCWASSYTARPSIVDILEALDTMNLWSIARN